MTMFGYTYYIGNTQPDALVEYQTFASEGINDMFEWGRQKLSNEGPKVKSDTQKIQDDLQNNNEEEDSDKDTNEKKDDSKNNQKDINDSLDKKGSNSDEDVTLNYGET